MGKSKKREKAEIQIVIKKPAAVEAEVNIEIPELFDLDHEISDSLRYWDSRVNNQLFKPASLRRFLQTTLAEVNTTYSLSTTTM